MKSILKIILNVLILFLGYTKQLVKCNLPLMRKFMLNGMKFSIYDRMEICGHVRDKCCTVADEIKVTKLWHQQSKPILESHIDHCMYFISKIMKQFFSVGRLDPRLMSLKYLVHKKIPLEQEICNFEIREEVDEEKKKFEIVYDEALKKAIINQKLVMAHMTGNAEMEQQEEEEIIDELDEADKDKKTQTGENKTEAAKDTSKPAEANKTETDKSKQTNRQLAEANQQAQKQTEEQPIQKNGERPEVEPEGQKVDIDTEIANIDLTKYTHDEAGYRHWGVKTNPEFEYLKKKNESAIPHFIEDNIDFRHVDCKKVHKVIDKEFVIINKKKAHYCYDLYDKILDFDNVRFSQFIKNTKSGLMLMARYKGAFYCSLCDAHAQKFLDTTTQTLQFSEEYCRNILIGNSSVIKFLHIVFIEYADFLIQYMECFETDAQIYNLPFTNFLNRFKRRIPLIEKCYENVEADDFMTSCWFLCQQYEFNDISGFFEGDVMLYRRIYLIIYSFLRKMQQVEKESKNLTKNTIGTVNGLIMEPLNPSLTITKEYFMAADMRKQILGTLHTYPEISLGEIKMAQEMLKVTREKKAAEALEALKGIYVKLDDKRRNVFKRLARRIKKFEKNKRIPSIANTLRHIIEGEHIKNKHEPEIKMEKGFTPIRKLSKKPLSLIMNQTSRKLNLNTQQNSQQNSSNSSQTQNQNQNQTQNQNQNQTQNQNQNQNNQQTNQNQNQNQNNQQTDQNKESQFVKVDNEEQTKEKIEQDQKKDEDVIKKAMNSEQDPMLQDKNLVKEEEDLTKDEEIELATVLHVEPAAQIFDKNENNLKIDAFKIKFGKEGMNPVTHIQLVDFDLDISQLIVNKFKQPEKIKNHIIQEYLQMGPSKVNLFNHIIFEHMISASAMQAVAHKYLEAKQKLVGLSDPIERKKHRKVIKKMVGDIKHNIMKQEEKKLLKKLKKQNLDMRLEKMRNNTVSVNNHIDEPYFDNNFHGIRDMFVQLFGT